MRKQMVQGITAAAVIALTAACDSTSTNPSLDLDTGEAEFIAVEADAILESIVADYVGTFGEDLVSASDDLALTGAAEPIVTTFTFERTRPCVAGGQVVANGSGEHSFDREIKTRETNAEGTKTISACARVRGDLTYTLDGTGIFDFHRLRVDGAPSGLQTTNQSGEFMVTVSDGRVEDCDYELHRVLDPDAGTLSVTGMVCDREVNRVITLDG